MAIFFRNRSEVKLMVAQRPSILGPTEATPAQVHVAHEAPQRRALANDELAARRTPMCPTEEAGAQSAAVETVLSEIS